VFSGGLGLNMGRLGFDLCVEYIYFQDHEVPASEYVFAPETGVADNFAGIYGFNALTVVLATRINLN
jgi:hypothetical protein